MGGLFQKTLCSLLIALPVLAGHRDFQNSDWGKSREQVMRAEGKPVSSSDSILEYSAADFLGAPARLLYVFTNNKLTRAICVFTADHADPNQFIADYRAAEPRLLEAHGKPSLERAVWSDEEFQTEPTSYLDQDRATPSAILPSDRFVGEEVARGHLRLYTRWEGERSVVLHALSGKDARITHQVEYRSAKK